METMQWIDHERSTWKVLPLHPQLHWFESLSSYIIRLAVSTPAYWLILVFGESQGNPLSSAPVKQVLDR
jgi:hypothetical protein